MRRQPDLQSLSLAQRREAAAQHVYGYGGVTAVDPDDAFAYWLRVSRTMGDSAITKRAYVYGYVPTKFGDDHVRLKPVEQTPLARVWGDEPTETERRTTDHEPIEALP